VIPVPGEIGIVMTDAYEREKNLEKKDCQRKNSDGVEDLLLDQKRIPPIAHLGKQCFMFGLEP
jgi:hypothetical protein